MMDLGFARTLLFVPADRPERIDKALQSEADLVVVDLEDAISEKDKVMARQSLEEFLVNSPSVEVVVRINASKSHHFKKDLALCDRFESVKAVMVPKAGKVGTLPGTSKPLLALVETAEGILAIPELACRPGVSRLCFGALDLCSDLNLTFGRSGVDDFLNHCRVQMVLHSRVSGLPAPLDSVNPELNDMEVIRNAADNAGSYGFGGMMCIHPKQLSEARNAFLPSESDLSWAKEVLHLSATQCGAFEFQGKMIDAPVLDRAHRILNENR